MLTTTIRGLLAHKLRLFATALAVSLGVAFLAGTLVLTDTIRSTFDGLFADAFRGTDASVREKAAFEGPTGMGDQRGRISASVIDAVQGAPGVAAAEGQVFGYARLIGSDGKALGNPANGAPSVGTNWSDVKQLNSFSLVDGRPPRADDEVVIDKKSSDDGKLGVGDIATVLVQGPPQKVRISGVARFGKADSPGGATFVMFKMPVAQRLVAEPGKFDSIAVVARDGVSQEQLVRNLRSRVPPGAEVVTGEKITEENQSAIRQVLSTFNTFMIVFALIALFVGAFMIFNTFSITVAQRTRENALLRALGASRRQVLASVVGEALIVGLVASVIGLVAGVLVAAGLKALLESLGLFGLPTSGMVFEPRTAVVSILAGVVVTTVAATSPARKAGKVPPVAAMHGISAESSGYGSRQRVIVGALVLATGVGALLYGLFGDVDSALQVVGMGAVLTFFGVSILGRTIALPLSRFLGWPLPRLRGIAGELARENAMRNPKRTASSATALMIGVGLVGFITILAASTKVSLNAAVERSFVGDFVIDSGAGASGGVDPGLAKRVAALPEVQTATGVRIGVAKVAGSATVIAAADPATAFDIIDVKPVAGSPRDRGRDAIAVSEDKAKDKRLRLGDRVPVDFATTGRRTMRVALIFAEDQFTGPYLLGTPAYEANFSTRLDSQVYVKRAPGTTSAAALAAVKRASRAYPGVQVRDQTDIKREQAKQVNQMLSLVYAMLALTIVIALLGIGNTLALSIFERTRELGLLRAVGMTRAQLRSAIRWESVIIALQGTLLGLLIGLFFGWALVRALSDQGIDRLAIPVTSLAVVVVLAALAGVVAAVLPSRRAAKLDVLQAIIRE